MKNLIFTCFVLISLYACSKESNEDQTLTGKVFFIEEQEGEELDVFPDYEMLGTPMENVPVSIWFDQAEYELEDCCWFSPDWIFRTIVQTDVNGVFSFTKAMDAYPSKYKVTVEGDEYHYIPTNTTDGDFGLAIYKNCKLPITIIDTNLESENTFCIETDTYKTEWEFGKECFNEYNLSEDGTKRIYKMSVDIYANYNSSLTLKVNNENHSVIEHFTGSQSDPKPLVISIN